MHNSNIVPGVLDEWLSMSQADQTGLVMAKLDEEFPLTEWLLWVVHQADGEWLPAHPFTIFVQTLDTRRQMETTIL